jgi:hypothetical protein|tara:strand:+ start:257 stop:442 length:186 start_codon:yes stop_codon:yes gene_type:complete
MSDKTHTFVEFSDQDFFDSDKEAIVNLVEDFILDTLRDRGHNVCSIEWRALVAATITEYPE